MADPSPMIKGMPTATTPTPRYISTLREHRQAKGLSQEALAREVNVSRQTIVNIEQGLSEPKVLLALALAGVLCVAIDELFKKGLFW